MCCTDKGSAQYYTYHSIYPTIYDQYPSTPYINTYPGLNSIFSSNEPNFGRTPVKSPIYFPSPTTFAYPQLTYDIYGRLVVAPNYRAPAKAVAVKSTRNKNMKCFHSELIE